MIVVLVVPCSSMIDDDSAGDVKMEGTYARLLLLCDGRLKYGGKCDMDFEVISAQYLFQIHVGRTTFGATSDRISKMSAAAQTGKR